MVEKMRSEPLLTKNSCWLVPAFRSHSRFEVFSMPRISTGCWSGP